MLVFLLTCKSLLYFKDSSRESVVICSVTVGPGEGMAVRQGYITVQHTIPLPEVKYFINYSVAILMK